MTITYETLFKDIELTSLSTSKGHKEEKSLEPMARAQHADPNRHQHKRQLTDEKILVRKEKGGQQSAIRDDASFVPSGKRNGNSPSHTVRSGWRHKCHSRTTHS